MSSLQKSRFQPYLDVAATIVLIATCGVVAWSVFDERLHPITIQAANIPAKKAARVDVPTSVKPISLSGAPAMGRDSAKVAIVEYSDFECPFCAKFAREEFPQVRDTLIAPGKALFVFRHFPLQSKHANAFRASEESECARQQHRFWEAHDVLFQNQRTLERLDISASDANVGLNAAQYSACMSSSSTAAAIQRDIDSANSLSVTGTPAFFVGRVIGTNVFKAEVRLIGVQTAQQLGAAVDRVLAGKGSH